MNVTFKKTGERRYGVFVERETAPALMMHPAPGFDDFLPHDLLHFVAEAEWGLDGAVFGQLAAGGDAGTFWPVDKELLAKAMRRRRRLRKRHHKGGRRSELLADVLDRAWRARSAKTALPEDWDERLAAARVDRERLDAVVASLDDLADRWHALRIGGSLELEWPPGLNVAGTHVRPLARRDEAAAERARGALAAPAHDSVIARSGGRRSESRTRTRRRPWRRARIMGACRCRSTSSRSSTPASG